uniref:RNase H domain-containing protein n=1 Tax=Steinernema glaseri TaxID=37863 RepID=A0A1I7Z438_9BILA
MCPQSALSWSEQLVFVVGLVVRNARNRPRMPHALRDLSAKFAFGFCKEVLMEGKRVNNLAEAVADSSACSGRAAWPTTP